MQVEDRTAATLMPVIQQFIKPGSTVISDQWAGYSEIGQYSYQHLTINHSEHFVDPGTEAQTQNIQCTCLTRRVSRRECEVPREICLGLTLWSLCGGENFRPLALRCGVLKHHQTHRRALRGVTVLFI